MPIFMLLFFILAVAVVGAGLYLLVSVNSRKAENLVTTERRKTQPRSVTRPSTKRGLINQTLQARLDKALSYKKQIDSLVKAAPEGNARIRLQGLFTQVSEWTQAITELAQRLDNLQQNPLIRQDLESVPKSIEEIKARLVDETNEATYAELERTLNSRQNQLASLRQLQSTVDRAELHIERTLSFLGTIYSQILTGQSTDHVADYSRLSTEVEEEVYMLQDHLEALAEVKLGGDEFSVTV